MSNPALFSSPAAGQERALRGLGRGYLASVGAALLSVAALNWLVNPWRIYPTSLVPPRVSPVRLQKCLALRQFEPRPQQLVLGSSRMELFEPARLARLTGLRTFNASVPGAVPLDDLLMYRFATEGLGAPVRSVVLGVEASTLRDHTAAAMAIARDEELRRFLPGEASHFFCGPAALARLLSGAQARDSLRCLRAELDGTNRVWGLCRRDGMIREQHRPEHRFPRSWDLARRIRDSMTILPSPGRLDPASAHHLRQLLARLRRDGVRTVVVATPMHAAARAVWRRDGYADDEQQALRLLAAIAREYHVPIVDFSTPQAFGGDPDGFFDGYHPNLANSRRMVDALFPEGGRL